MTYDEFLKTKVKNITVSGFDVEYSEMLSILFDFQKFTVKRAIKAGKYAIFADTGLGKTLMQLDIARLINIRENKPVLILAPLAVTGQTKLKGDEIGIKVEFAPCDNTISDFPIQISNYDQLENINITNFCCVILDESSILKNETGAFRNLIINTFIDIPYKFCFSATPSPNDPMELGNHSEFLDVMRYQEMLAMFFTHDGGETNKWRLKGHAIERFYEFVSTWAIMYSHPKDIGFIHNDFDLPKLNLHEIVVKTPIPDGFLFGGQMSVNATDYNSSLRDTEDDRIKETIKIVKTLGSEQILIWAKQNQEASKLYNEIKKLGYDCRNVQGSDSVDKKYNDLIGFAKNDFQILITKEDIASQGMNYQNCHYQIFNSIDFSFEKAYQAMRRCWRFGQKHNVDCWMITTDRMTNVTKIQKDKQSKFKTMQHKMTDAVNKNINKNITTSMESIDDIINENYHLMRGDCVRRIKEVEDNKAGLVIFSPPFPQIYTYSSHIEDMGNSFTFPMFVRQFEYLIPELKRTLQDGRICAVHCMDLPIQKGKEGYIGLRDFSGVIVRMFQKYGFIYHSRITIWKDPVVEMQRTKALGLLHKQVKKDSSMSRVGIPDYVLIFRNDGENKEPITNTHIPVDLWQKIASPVWMDIDQGNTLNYMSGRDEKDEKHICPLQLDTIERLILLYSNKGDTILSPFGGIGSEGYQALKMNRKSISIELKESYFRLNKRNHYNANEDKNQQILFE